jgi:hypothetical protein
MGLRAAVSLVAALLLPFAVRADEPKGTIPITTSSAEARNLYLQGRDLAEKLHGTHALFAKAVAKDPDFALAHLQLANTAPSAKEFFASLRTAA